MAKGWTDVKSRGGCPICGRKDWCGYKYDTYDYNFKGQDRSTGHQLFIHCQGLQGSTINWGDTIHTAEGVFSYYGTSTKDRAPMFVNFDLKGNGDMAVMERKVHRPQASRIVHPRFNDTKLNELYRFILSKLTLSDEHRKKLNADGITDTMIERHCIKTLPKKRWHIMKELSQRYGDLTGLPGAHLVTHKTEWKNNRRVEVPLDNPYWDLAGPEGILFSISNFYQEIVALRVRLDNPSPNQGKYLYVSSDGGKWENSVFIPYYNNGSSSGARIGVVFPAVRGDFFLCYDTEGEKKSYVVADKLGYPCLNFPGVNSWAELVTPNDRGEILCDLLMRMGVRMHVIAYDNDKYENHKVMAQQQAVINELKSRGNGTGVAEWDSYAGKGIDDCLNKGYKPMYFLI